MQKDVANVVQREKKTNGWEKERQRGKWNRRGMIEGKKKVIRNAAGNRTSTGKAV